MQIVSETRGRQNRGAFINVSSGSGFRDLVVTFRDIDFFGPALLDATDSSVVLGTGNYTILPGTNGRCDELAEAAHIRLEGNVHIYKDAPGIDEVFRIERADGGITVARDAVVTAVLNRDHRRAHRSGFVHFQRSGGYLRFEEDSFFSFEGNGFFSQHRDKREVTIGARAVVDIRTHGNFKGNYGIFMLRGDMVVEEDAIVHLVALGNTKRAPIIQFDKKISTLRFNNPEEVFIYNSSTHRKDRGSAIGLEGSADSFDIFYNGITTLGYWEENIMPPDNLGPPTYGWQNPDESAYSVSYRMDRKAVTNLRTDGYFGPTPFTAKNTHLFDVNVIYIGGGTAKNHEVVFNPGGGFFPDDGSEAPRTVEVSNGSAIGDGNMPPDPEHSNPGFYFDGW
jgi:hypothetical protein